MLLKYTTDILFIHQVALRMNTPWGAGRRCTTWSMGRKPCTLPSRRKAKTWDIGLWIGKVGYTNEAYIGTREGVVTAFTAKRLGEQERWDAMLMVEMKGAPWDRQWRPHPDDQRPKEAEAPAQPPPIIDPPAVKAFYVMRSDIAKYGHTPHCPGCLAIMNNNAPTPNPQQKVQGNNH